MRSYVVLGAAAALVAASPAPQGFDSGSVDAIPVTLTQGPPVGVGQATQGSVYNQDAAQATAAAAASPTQASANNKRSLEGRTFCLFGLGLGCGGNSSHPAATITTTRSKTTTTSPTVTLSPTNSVPSTCTPLNWTNTFAFTTNTACPTPYEVGTFCGFINPEDPCAPQPGAYGPPTIPDTAKAFVANPVYQIQALSAKTPSGYINTFKDLDAAVTANGYLGYKVLSSYDVAGCAAYCDQTDLCTGFNVYVERDPAWNPWQCSCPNPNGIANYKCSIWGGGVNASSATNSGQSRDGLEVVITGSNGYQQSPKSPPTPSGYGNPQNCSGKLHNQQQYCLGQQSFPGPFDASLCSAYADSQNQANQKAGFLSGLLSSILGYSNSKCVQFQAAELQKDGHSWGTHCRLFTKTFKPSQANLDISAGGSSWSCGKSWTFDLA